jgi:alkyldihydroxyacetonephosphate synthase
MERLQRVMGQVSGQEQQSAVAASSPAVATAAVNGGGGGGGGTDDSSMESNLRWNGWGYKDTKFELNDKKEATLLGNRYLFSGKTLPALRTWMETNVGMDMNNKSPAQDEHVAVYPAPIKVEAFVNDVAGHYHRLSFDTSERVFHSHGHTAQEIFALRYGQLKRVVDAVIYPRSHEDCEVIVASATRHNVCILPFGGGTTVSHALMCSELEQRMIVGVDMRKMNKIKWVNHNNMLACIEAGASGKALEERLKGYDVVMGHEPDSAEFSTLGGWIATRASGMRKNRYGNIEDIVVQVKMVTPKGTMVKSVQVPRMSSGPDIHHMIMGSEGTLGLITEAVVKICKPPAVTKYGSIVFPNFESGVAMMHEVALKKCAPVSIRLVDNPQFQFGAVLKPGNSHWSESLLDAAKKWYILKVKDFKADNMVAATLLFEGTAAEIKAKEKQLYAIAAKYGGMKAGEENGVRGYFLTYMIAYLRDFGFDYKFLAESFETSVPWDNVLQLCINVKEQIKKEAAAQGVGQEPFVSCRVTQVYDTGACVYFYFGFLWQGLKDPLAVFHSIEHAARSEILRLGGSISHHHGVGKCRKEFLEHTISPVGVTALKGLKTALDPTNIFSNGNVVDVEGFGPPTVQWTPGSKGSH